MMLSVQQTALTSSEPATAAAAAAEQHWQCQMCLVNASSINKVAHIPAVLLATKQQAVVMSMQDCHTVTARATRCA